MRASIRPDFGADAGAGENPAEPGRGDPRPWSLGRLFDPQGLDFHGQAIFGAGLLGTLCMGLVGINQLWLGPGTFLVKISAMFFLPGSWAKWIIDET